MPTSDEIQQIDAESRMMGTMAQELVTAWEAMVQASIKQNGFSSTLKSLKKSTRHPGSGMMTSYEGVIEKLPSGRFDAALQTDQGRVVLRNAPGTHDESTDMQSVSSNPVLSHDAAVDSDLLTPDLLVDELATAGANPPCSLLCEVELARFDDAQRQVLLPLLWQYILDHRNSNEHDELVAVGAAIRKYIAIMPMDQMGELAGLLETGHRSPLPIELEIEVTKMIYRNFEVHPPIQQDPQPELATRLWEMVQAYINPRVLLREKHSAATSLAIEGIVAMRSPLAERAWQAAQECPYRWFGEMVNDDLSDLRTRWLNRSDEAIAWLDALRDRVLVMN